MEYIIEMSDIVKCFKQHCVLNHVDLKVKKGTICGLVGTNGSGKTVLLKVLCGFMLPDNGTVYVNGSMIGKERDFPHDTGVIIENPSFSQYTSGFNNLKNLAAIQGKISDDDISNTMKRVGLDPNNKKWVSKYSLGMKQRLGIAQAIMENQSILILDEPMNGLDRQGVEEVRKVLHELKLQGKTIVLASHYPQDIEILCDEVYEINNGVVKPVVF